MAVIEQEIVAQEIVPEVVREIRIPISREQEEALAHAASVSGLSVEEFVEEFAVSALIRAAEETVSNQVLPSSVEKRAMSAAESFANDVKWRQFLRSGKEDPLDKIIGIFQDEPLMEALMERIREDRRVEIERLALEADTED